MVDYRLIRKFFNPGAMSSRTVDLCRLLLSRAGRRYPMFVQFLMTARCNLDCAYCEVPPFKYEEMSRSEVMEMLDELCRAGMRKITFSGGEPLVREDLGDCVRFVRKRGVFANIITNGILLPMRLDDLKGIDLIVVSLDGPKECHDQVRGKGSFDGALKALELCREKGIPFMTSTVISKTNIDRLDFVLDLTRRFGTTAIFQPIELGHAETLERSAGIMPGENELRDVYKFLLERKKSGDKISYPGRLLKTFIDGRRVSQCRWAGRLFCSILPDGRVLPCNLLLADNRQWKNGRSAGFVRAMEQMPPFQCGGCHAGYSELDSLLSFRLWDL